MYGFTDAVVLRLSIRLGLGFVLRGFSIRAEALFGVWTPELRECLFDKRDDAIRLFISLNSASYSELDRVFIFAEQYLILWKISVNKRVVNRFSYDELYFVNNVSSTSEIRTSRVIISEAQRVKVLLFLSNWVMHPLSIRHRAQKLHRHWIRSMDNSLKCCWAESSR